MQLNHSEENVAKQKTIKTPVTVEAKGLFGGTNTKLRFCPAPEDTGICFIRTDTPDKIEIPAEIEFLSKRDIRTTSLCRDNVTIETTEHVLAAVRGLDLDNIYIEMDGPEVPSTDGSALPFVQALQKAGVEQQDLDREVHIIEEPIVVSDGESMIAALPGPTDCLEIIYDLEYSAPSIGRQVLSYKLGKEDFAIQLAPARTFLLEAEARQFQAMGLGQHLSEDEVLVMSDSGPLGSNSLRYPDEHVRHKVLDLIGDLALLGKRFYGRVVATKSGHQNNHQLVQKITELLEEQEKSATGEPVMDIRKIMRLLPHRYPFLMIDRVVSIDGDKKAVGIKNVSINEPFFQGHYPNLPIMPGVLIVEAMAQLSGILLGRRLQHTGKVAVLLSMDKVKMRRPVRPGDQLILEAEGLHARSRIGHCRCRALVGDDLAAEAEIKFMLVDSEPV